METKQCNPDPRAPHGFMRDESHSQDRYVCKCEFWEPSKITHLDEYFRQLRFDPHHHLDMGDIRLTMGQQEDIIEFVEEQIRGQIEEVLRGCNGKA